MKETLYGLMAEFKNAEELKRAARMARKEGFQKMDAFSPYPVEGLAELLGQSSTIIGWISLFCGAIGALSGYALQYYSSGPNYPLNVGGRPINSWPAFVPVCFELTVLFAAMGAVLSMFLLNRLPRPYHPVFNSNEFEAASKDRFFLLIKKTDPLFHNTNTKLFLNSTQAEKVIEVFP